MRRALDISGTPGSVTALKETAGHAFGHLPTKAVGSLLAGSRALAVGTISLRLDLTPELETVLIPSFRMLVGGVAAKRLWLAAAGQSYCELVVDDIGEPDWVVWNIVNRPREVRFTTGLPMSKLDLALEWQVVEGWLRLEPQVRAFVHWPGRRLVLGPIDDLVSGEMLDQALRRKVRAAA
jgi:hypothetical protein